MDAKKILFIDKDTIRSETRAVLLNQVRHHEVEVADNAQTARSAYGKGGFDMVVIDLACDWTGVLLDEILKANPQQSIIALGGDAHSCIRSGCGFCQDNYRMRLMVEPFPIQTFFAYIDDFDFHPCQHTDRDATRLTRP